jgi:hypothetical protein
MIRNITLPCCLLLITIFGSCKKTYDIDAVVINEIMAVNFVTAADQNGQFDDWIELHNITPDQVDISGYYLSDSKSNPSKWKIPSGTTIAPNGYLIFWADKDTTQSGLHTNFKLSSLGESLVLSKPDKTTLDKVTYPAQTLELSYSRYPDGTGEFRWQNPSFGRVNGGL